MKYFKVESLGEESPALSRESPKTFVFLILGSLAIVDCAITIARRVAVGLQRVTLHTGAVLLLSELMKLVFSLYKVFEEQRTTAVDCLPSKQYLRDSMRGALQILPVCILYLVANLLSYVALSKIPASVFAAVCQLKVLTTAFFAVTILRSKVSFRRWRTLTLMVLGVIVITLSTQPIDCPVQSHVLNNESASSLQESFEYFFGVSCALLQSVFTGLACIVLEMVLKWKVSIQTGNGKVTQTIWDRNLQLSMCSVFIYGPIAIRENGWYIIRGWSTMVWSISILHAVGGILVALSIIHASSITKTVAVCAGLVLTSLLGGAFGDSPPLFISTIGSLIVGLTILSYRDDIEIEEQLSEE